MARKILLSSLLVLFLTPLFSSNVHALRVDAMDVLCGKEEIEYLEPRDTVSQYFVSEADMFSFVAVKLSSPSDESADIEFRIKEATSDEWYFEDVYAISETEMPFNYFAFYPIPDAKGKEFVFEIENVDSDDQSVIGVHFSFSDCRENSSAYKNGEKVEGDVVFKLAFTESARTQFLADIEAGILSDNVFLVFWLVVVIVLFVFLFVSNVKHSDKA